MKISRQTNSLSHQKDSTACTPARQSSSQKPLNPVKCVADEPPGQRYAVSAGARARAAAPPRRLAKSVRSQSLQSDDSLVVNVKLGDLSSWSILYQRYHPKVYRRCLSMTQSPAEAQDLAQDALLKALEHLGTFQGRASFSTWVYTITCNHCREFFRRTRKVATTSLEEFMHPLQEDVPPQLIAQDDENWEERDSYLLGLMHHIPEAEQQLLRLKYYHGHSIEELQQQFHLSASAVKMRLKRSKQKLQNLYAHSVFYPEGVYHCA